MATLNDILQEKLNRMDSIPDAFVGVVDRVQTMVFDEVLILVNQLERDALNKILLTQGNLVIVDQIMNRLSEVFFGTEYQTALVNFAAEFNAQGLINDEYFKKIMGKAFDVEALYKNILTSAQKNAVLMLGDDAITPLLTPIRDILNTSINTGQSFGQTVKSLKDFIIGNQEINGQIVRYVKRVAFDAFAVADRQYTQIVAEDLDFEWYKYQGDLIKDSREFCVKRTGQYWHKREVMSWGLIKQWQGRNKDTNSSTIFTYLGGYNCKHSIMPVGRSVVPQSAIQRAISKGIIIK